MSSTTISLENSTYELLKARKRPDESFSEEVVRLLGDAGPTLRGFLEIVSEKDGKAVAEAIEGTRKEDLETAERKRRGGRNRGRFDSRLPTLA